MSYQNYKLMKKYLLKAEAYLEKALKQAQGHKEKDVEIQINKALEEIEDIRLQ